MREPKSLVTSGRAVDQALANLPALIDALENAYEEVIDVMEARLRACEVRVAELSAQVDAVRQADLPGGVA